MGKNTTYKHFYKPSLGASGATELATYDTKLDRLDAFFQVDCKNYDHPDDAITAIGASNKTLIVTEVETCDTNFIVPANVTVKFERGGKWTINTGITVTFNGSLSDCMHEIFDLTGTGTIAGLRKTDFLRPEWFGARGDYNTTTKTGTDDSSAFQKVINIIIANKLDKLRLSHSNYYFASTVDIEPTTDHHAGMIIEGVGKREEHQAPRESAIYGSSGLVALFDLGNSSDLWFAGTEFIGVKFAATTDDIAVKSAIKITSEYSCIYNLTIDRCYFYGFTTAAIYAKSTIAYNLAFVSVTNSSFLYGGYSFLLDNIGNANEVRGLYFVNNNCPGGKNGAIKGAFGAGVFIVGNNFEGGANTIDLNGIAFIEATIKSNYFETNDGDFIINIDDLNMGIVDIGGNYYYNCTATTYITLNKCGGIISDEVSYKIKGSRGSIKLSSTLLLGDKWLGGDGDEGITVDKAGNDQHSGIINVGIDRQELMNSDFIGNIDNWVDEGTILSYGTNSLVINNDDGKYVNFYGNTIIENLKDGSTYKIVIKLKSITTWATFLIYSGTGANTVALNNTTNEQVIYGLLENTVGSVTFRTEDLLNVEVDYVRVYRVKNKNIALNNNYISNTGADNGILIDDNGIITAPTFAGNIKRSVQAGITAYATGGQANAVAITKDVAEISVCATAGDSVKLPAAVAGLVVLITNHGAAAADVFPNTDDAINEAAANAAKSLGVDASMLCIAYDATNWECLTLAR